MKRARRAAFFLALTAAFCVPGASAQNATKQYEAKARFLTVLPDFVEWPASTFETSTAPLQLCVFGEFSFGISLAELARDRSVEGHRIGMKWIRKEEELANCQLLFVSRSEAKRYDKVLGAVKNSLTLTIGEEPEFLKAGGMMILQPTENGVSFDVNLDAVRDGHLKLSSQLLALARHVVHRTESARS